MVMVNVWGPNWQVARRGLILLVTVDTAELRTLHRKWFSCAPPRAEATNQCKVTSSSRSQAAAAAFCPLVSIETWVARWWWVWRGRGGDTSKNCPYSAGKCGTGHPTMWQTLLRIVHTLISLLVSSLNSPSSLLSGLPSGPLGWQHWINIWLLSPPNCNFKIGSQYLDNEQSAV